MQIKHGSGVDMLGAGERFRLAPDALLPVRFQSLRKGIPSASWRCYGCCCHRICVPWRRRVEPFDFAARKLCASAATAFHAA
eukprot:826625-Pleurochrysis_carterae.AAC.7